jgi:hypothetical protein
MLKRTVVIGIGIGWFSETVYLQIRFLISLRRAMDMKTHIEGVVFVTLLLLPKVCVARRMLSMYSASNGIHSLPCQRKPG